ncbi:sensor histidine kinase [Bradyrhizobium paxllaeri]|uniref:sensor histidine kinase n=1 Tax=Bradyrhizobium paxllaeri TaxID=190148 RepID=UPI001FE4AD6C|nr:HAMP domain-containing sensor histidine kinase [Bradyrhizobium paxllaeri]
MSVVITIVVVCTAVLLLGLVGDDGGYAQYDAATAIKAAISRNERGELVINEHRAQTAKPTPTVSEFKRDFPGFWFVVSDGHNVLHYGPVPERIMAGLAHQGDRASSSGYEVHGESMQLVRSASIAQTDAGNVLIEVGGVAYSGTQIAIGTIKDTSFMTIPILVVLITTVLAALVIVPVLIARPVRRAAAAAEMIDGAGEGVRLPEQGAPLELIPMVSAFNRALERIDATVAAQRRFLSNVAHELRTPLARVRTRLEDIDDKTLKAALVADLQSLSSTVTMLLQLARLSSGPAESADVDLVELTKRIAAEHGPTALYSDIEIEFSSPAEIVKIKGSDQAIGIALSNIVRNALQYSRRGQQVLIEVDRTATVRVVDHGPGIKPEDRAAVLQPFVRRRQDGDGTGLGLAIVAQVMALHKGFVTIEDTVGGGTTVVLKFSPLTPSQSQLH